MKPRFYFACFLIMLSVFVYIQSSAHPESNNDGIISFEEYPYTIYPLSESQISEIKSEFMKKNYYLPGDVRQLWIDEYGLMSYFKRKPYSSKFKDKKIKLIEETTVINMVKEFIVKNSKVTGVLNKEDLVIEVIGRGSLNSNWYMVVKDQKFHGIKLAGQFFHSISVTTDSEGRIIVIQGHFFPDIKIPREPKINKEEAKNIIIGKNEQQGNFLFKEEDLLGVKEQLHVKEQLVIYPLKINKRLEFRLCWQINLVLKTLNSWRISIDAITGEVVEKFETSIN